MANPVTGLRLDPELVEHYDILSEVLGISRSELMKAALERGRDANPVDDAARAAYRAKRAAGSRSVRMNPDGSFRAVLWAAELEAAAKMPAAKMRERVLRIAGELDRAEPAILDEVKAMIDADAAVDAARAQRAAEAADPELVAVLEEPRGVAGDRCESGSNCGRTGCPECQQ